VTVPATAGPHMLSAALFYAGAGIPVFPVNDQKEPLTGKGGFHLASTDRAQVEEWWTAHPQAGIATPAFDVVDVDLYKPECEPTWKQIAPLIPEGTPQSKTTRGGLIFLQGRHARGREDRPRCRLPIRQSELRAPRPLAGTRRAVRVGQRG
jgi:Bifunctional DNA primase/polymerase, N-terminal